MSQKALELLQARFGDAVLETGTTLGQDWARVRPEELVAMATFLKTEPALDMKLLADIATVDFLHFDPERPLALDAPDRFEVNYEFGSVTKPQRVRLKVRCGGETPTVPSISSVYRTANWWERLSFDMLGVRFEGHPDLRRILLYDEFKGHPLRKDYPIHLRQPLIPERQVQDLVRGPGPGSSDKHAPFSQRPGARPNTRSDAYD